MHKIFFISLFSMACYSTNTMSVHAGEKYYCTDNPYSYSQYNVDYSEGRILVNTIHHKDTQNTTNNNNEILDNLSNETNIENHSDNNQIIVPPKEQELWLKTSSEATAMDMITDKCVSLLEIYKLAFNNKANVNNFSDTNEVLNSGNKLVTILLQLQKSHTLIFIPSLVFAIKKVNQTSKIQPLAYIDDILYSHNSPENLIIYFYIDQLAKHLEHLTPEVYNTADDDSKNSTKTITNRIRAVYRINIQTMHFSFVLHITRKNITQTPTTFNLL